MDKNKKIGLCVVTLLSLATIIGVIIGLTMTSSGDEKYQRKTANNGKSLNVSDKKPSVHSSTSATSTELTKVLKKKYIRTSPKIVASTINHEVKQLTGRKIVPETNSKTSKNTLPYITSKTAKKSSTKTSFKISRKSLLNKKSKNNVKPATKKGTKPIKKPKKVVKPSSKTKSKRVKKPLKRTTTKRPTTTPISVEVKRPLKRTTTKRPTTTSTSLEDCFRYELTSKKLNFWQARWQCKAKGGDIVSNNLSPSGQKFHRKIIAGLNAQKYTWIWLGVRRRGGHLKFLDDTRISRLMFPWAGGEPNGYEEKQNCVTVNYHYEANWKVFDDDCNGQQYGLCELKC